MVWGWMEALSPMDWLFLSVFLMSIGWFLSRPRRLGREAHQQLGQEILQQAFPGVQLKVHAETRDVDGGMQSRLAVLDQVILDADRKIELLRKTLADLKSGPASRGCGEIIVFPDQFPRETTIPRADAA